MKTSTEIYQEWHNALDQVDQEIVDKTEFTGDDDYPFELARRLSTEAYDRAGVYFQPDVNGYIPAYVPTPPKEYFDAVHAEAKGERNEQLAREEAERKAHEASLSRRDQILNGLYKAYIHWKTKLDIPTIGWGGHFPINPPGNITQVWSGGSYEKEYLFKVADHPVLGDYYIHLYGAAAVGYFGKGAAEIVLKEHVEIEGLSKEKAIAWLEKSEGCYGTEVYRYAAGSWPEPYKKDGSDHKFFDDFWN